MATGNNIQEKINDIALQRNAIRDWLVTAGLAENQSKLSDCATAISGIAQYLSQDTVYVAEGSGYTIPAGYHDGTQMVFNTSEEDSGDYDLYQYGDITPSKSPQVLSVPEGYYGLYPVKVNAIPEAYQDVTSVTATASAVLTGSSFVDTAGKIVAGTMPNNGAFIRTLDTTTTSYTVPNGYHNGYGKVSITLEEQTVTPTKSPQTIYPTKGKVISKITVNSIPDEYISTKDANATAGEILYKKTAYVNGEKLTGTMADNTGFISSFTGLTADDSKIFIPAGYHDGNGYIGLTADIENELAKI